MLIKCLSLHSFLSISSVCLSIHDLLCVYSLQYLRFTMFTSMLHISVHDSATVHIDFRDKLLIRATVVIIGDVRTNTTFSNSIGQKVPSGKHPTGELSFCTNALKTTHTNNWNKKVF